MWLVGSNESQSWGAEGVGVRELGGRLGLGSWLPVAKAVTAAEVLTWWACRKGEGRRSP